MGHFTVRIYSPGLVLGPLYQELSQSQIWLLRLSQRLPEALPEALPGALPEALPGALPEVLTSTFRAIPRFGSKA